MRIQTNDSLFERYFRVQFVDTTIVKKCRKLEKLRSFKHFVYRYLAPLPVSRFPLVLVQVLACAIFEKLLFVFLEGGGRREKNYMQRFLLDCLVSKNSLKIKKIDSYKYIYNTYIYIYT